MQSRTNYLTLNAQPNNLRLQCTII